MLLKRYGFSGYEHILCLPFQEGIDMLFYCAEKDTDDKLFLRWNLEESTKSIANLFIKEKIEHLSFAEYKERLYGTRIKPEQPEPEKVLEKVKSIINNFTV